MRVATVIFYFFLAIIFFSSIGVWLPYIIEGAKDGGRHNPQGMVQNIVTYFLAIFFSAALDFFLKLMDKDDPARKLKILILVFVGIVVIGASARILYIVFQSIGREVIWELILGVGISYGMWWIVNYRNSSFDPSATMGGNPENPLTNG
jgi:hypothetical protein